MCGGQRAASHDGWSACAVAERLRHALAVEYEASPGQSALDVAFPLLPRDARKGIVLPKSS